MAERGEWFGAAELAGLPGLPGTERRVRSRAEREQWQHRDRAGRGGGREYHRNSLPKATRDHLLHKAVAALPAHVESSALIERHELPCMHELANWQRDIVNARHTVCSFLDETMKHTGQSAGPAIAALLEAATAGTLPASTMDVLRAANARRGTGGRLADTATIYRWLSARVSGPAALAPKATEPQLTPVWLAPLLKLYQKPQKPSVSACLRDWSEHYPNIPAPNPSRAYRHIKKIPAELREYGRMGRAALRAVQPFVRRTTDGLWPMDVVTADGHLFKAYVRHPMTGRKLRPEITTYLDIATRRAIGFSAWLAESQMAIWAALRDMVLHPDCGVPALHYSDNGAYRGEQHRQVLGRIGSSVMFSQAYRAQARGVIERFNSSVWVPLAKTLPTYVNDDADPEAVKKALKIANDDGANLVAWEDFCNRARRELDAYNNRSHRTLKGASPNEAWARAAADGWRPTLLENDDLHDLLPTKMRTVNRGWISLPWGHYYHDRLSAHHEQRVAVGVHPTDGSRVWCSDQRGVLICEAARDGNARPYVAASMLEEARAKREAGRLKRLERKIDDVREEGAVILDLPQADVAAARLMAVQEDEDKWFNAISPAEAERAMSISVNEDLAWIRENVIDER